MNPILDERPKLNGKPGLHVFLVGVSRYPALPAAGAPATPQSYGMRPLSAPARTAYQLYQWLLTHRDRLACPLATAWLLLSPSDTESQSEPALAGLSEPPTLMNFIQAAHAWRHAASTHPQGMTLFYFAGHGVQRTKDDAVLLLDEFGSLPPGADPLTASVDLRNLFYGMAPAATRPDMARRQLYFADACRNRPSQFNQFEQLRTAAIFQIELSGRDDRIAPIFYAAVPDSKGYAIAGQHTVFSRQLIYSLEGGAARPGAEDAQGKVRYEVTIHSLIQALTDRFNELTSAERADQEFTVGGQVQDTVLLHLAEPPLVNVVLACDPEAAHLGARLEVTNGIGEPVLCLCPIEPHPYQKALPAGLYNFRATFEANSGFKNWTRLGNLLPPRKEWTMKVA